jgi:hypothetical protein
MQSRRCIRIVRLNLERFLIRIFSLIEPSKLLINRPKIVVRNWIQGIHPLRLYELHGGSEQVAGAKQDDAQSAVCIIDRRG